MLTNNETDALLKAALREDIGQGDETSILAIPKAHVAKADAIFRESGVLFGLSVAEKIFRLIDPDLRFLPAAKDGEWIEAARAIFYVEGSCRSILAAERTVLNFLGHLSGVATLTRAFTEKVGGTKAVILHTRKTTPLLRKLECAAVIAGGGHPHRQGLYDGILIKDNHLEGFGEINLESIVQRARSGRSRVLRVGIEVQVPEDLEKVICAGFDYVLLDNFSVEETRRAVMIRDRLDPKVELEVSGGITLENVREYAEAGVERISIGSLTHSAKAIDVSLEILGQRATKIA